MPVRVHRPSGWVRGPFFLAGRLPSAPRRYEREAGHFLAFAGMASPLIRHRTLSRNQHASCGTPYEDEPLEENR